MKAKVYQDGDNICIASCDDETENRLRIEGNSEEKVIRVLKDYSVRGSSIEVKIDEIANGAVRIFPLGTDGWNLEDVVPVGSYDELVKALKLESTKIIVISDPVSIDNDFTIPAGRKILLDKDVTINGTLKIESFDDIYFLQNSGIMTSNSGTICVDNMKFSNVNLRKVDIKDNQIHIESHGGEATITCNEKTEDEILTEMRGEKYFLSCTKVKIKGNDTNTEQGYQEYIVNGGSLAAINKTYSFTDITELKNYLVGRNGIGLGSGSKIIVGDQVLFGPDESGTTNGEKDNLFISYRISDKTKEDFIAYVFIYQDDAMQQEQIVINYNEKICKISSDSLPDGTDSFSFENNGQSIKVSVYSEWSYNLEETANKNNSFEDIKELEKSSVNGLIIGKNSTITVGEQFLFGPKETDAVIQYEYTSKDVTEGEIVGYVLKMHGHIFVNYNANVCQITNIPESGFYIFEDEIIFVYSGFDSYEDTDEEWDVEQEE